MDIEFLRALASINNVDEPFCVLKKENDVYLYTNIKEEYNAIEKIPKGLFLTGWQDYDGKSGKWVHWGTVKKFKKYENSNFFTEFNEHKIDLKWNTNLDKNEFTGVCQKMINDMVKGNYFLANLTRKIFMEPAVDPVAIAIRSCFEHKCENRFFYYSPSYSYLSLSPERFISIKNKKIISEPIKGTGKTIEQLKRNEKDFEENTMIVDLVRSDLSKVCIPNSIKVEQYQNIVMHPGLAQMNSTVVGELENGFDIIQTIKTLMPIASISGTPKPRVVKAIDQYENTDRGIYCGAVGWLDTEKNECDLKVAIRGIETSNNVTSIGVGAGITARSNPIREFEETELKASRLVNLVEASEMLIPQYPYSATFINEKQEIFALDKQINRLIRAAKTLRIDINDTDFTKYIYNFLNQNKYKNTMLKIAIDQTGKAEITFDNSSERLSKFRNIGIAISIENMQATNFEMKTYPRNNYTDLFSQSQQTSNMKIDECLICINNYIKESTRANIFVRKGNEVFTPGLKGKIINGIFRQVIFENFNHNQLLLSEKNIRIDELVDADEIVLVNSVRGSSLIDSIDSKIFPELNSYSPKDNILDNFLNELYEKNSFNVNV